MIANLRQNTFWIFVTLAFCQLILVCTIYLRAPADGYVVTWAGAGLPTVTGQFDDRASGLIAHDKILSIGEFHIKKWKMNLASFPRAMKSTTGVVQYEIIRNGQQITVPVRQFRLGMPGFLKLCGISIFLFILFLVSAVIIYLRVGLYTSKPAFRSGGYKTARVVCYALLASAGVIIATTQLPVGVDTDSVRLVSVPGYVLSGISFALYLQFVLSFPPREGILTRYKSAKFWLHASYLAISVPAALLAVFGSGEPRILHGARYAIVPFFVTSIIGIAFRSYARAVTPATKNQMMWLAWGFLLGLAPLPIYYVMILLNGAEAPMNLRLNLLSSALVPISLMLAISRHQLLEIEGFAKRSLAYTALMTALTGVYIAGATGGAVLLGMAVAKNNSIPIVIVLVAVFLIAFRPFKNIGHGLLTRAFYGGVSIPREVRSHLSQAISREIRLPEIADILVNRMAQRFMASGAALVVLNGDCEARVYASSAQLRDSVNTVLPDLLPILETNPSMWSDVLYPDADSQLGPTIHLPDGCAACFPLAIGPRLTGIFLIAGKESNWRYTTEELETLRALAHQASTAIDNAIAYEKLNELNADLEKQVAERTQQLVWTNSELESRNAELVFQNGELERLVKELTETQAALLSAERRAAIGEIVITVCHEINNPLTAIIGQTELLSLNGKLLPTRVLERVKVIEECADKIRSITERMRNLQNPTSVHYAEGLRMIDLHSEQHNPVPNSLSTATISVQQVLKSGSD